MRTGTEWGPTARIRRHHQSVAFVDYILSIDWLGAVGVGAVLVLIGLVFLRFMLATTSEVGHMLPSAGHAAGKALLDARDLPIDSWVCVKCRSVNTPLATHCYRGCGSRDELAEQLLTDRSIVTDARYEGGAR